MTIIQKPTANVMLGLSILGVLATQSPPNLFGSTSVKVITNQVDLFIKAAGHYHKTGKVYEKEEDLNTPENEIFLQLVKKNVRSMIEGVFIEEHEKLSALKNQEFENLKTKLSQTNKPHNQGTISELATKLGVSKSEVRRMKTEGTLDEALSKLEN